MSGPFGFGFQHGPDDLFNLFITDFARCSWPRFIPESADTAANETIPPVSNRARRRSGCGRCGGITHPFGTFENDSCTKDQAAVLPPFDNLFQFFSLAFRNSELKFFWSSSSGSSSHGLS